MKNEFKCKISRETYPHIAARIPINKCKNGHAQVSLVIYSIDVKTLIGKIVENVKRPKRDLIGENSSSSK